MKVSRSGGCGDGVGIPRRLFHSGDVGMLGMLPEMLGSPPAAFTRSHNPFDICYDVCEVLVIRLN